MSTIIFWHLLTELEASALVVGFCTNNQWDLLKDAICVAMVAMLDLSPLLFFPTTPTFVSIALLQALTYQDITQLCSAT